MPLPVTQILPELRDALREHGRALLIAPPGAGKTTAIAPALLDEQWCTGEILLLVPRRLAARAAADYMAAQRNERSGATIGYATRLDSRPGKRITVMTHGVYQTRIEADPELTGVSAVIFDEVHERSLGNDVALALTLDVAESLRPDLKLLAMSATLDSQGFARLLGDPPLIESAGKSYSLTIRHVGRDAARPIEKQMAAACKRALDEHEGSLLAFLPGVGEIERTAEALGSLPADVELHRLHGRIDPAAQRAALAKPAPGTRKLVLASSIAETSLTLEDVRIVVDSGRARRPRHDAVAGFTRLVTERASQAAATQRAGRAARQAPGVAIRLWEETATQALPPHDPPEMLAADLSPLLLTLQLWGAEPGALRWIDPPPEASLAIAERQLKAIEALGEDGRITPFGRKLAAMPMTPLHAAALLHGAAMGEAETAAQFVMLVQERGLGGPSEDLAIRLSNWRADRGKRASAARKLAASWAKKAMALHDAKPKRGPDAAIALARALPDNLARPRDGSGERWVSAGGRGFFLDPASPLATASWLLIADATGRAREARITAGLALDAAQVEQAFAERVERRKLVRWKDGRVEAVVEKRLGAIRLSSGPDPDPDTQAVTALLLDKARERLPDLLPTDLIARGRYAGIEKLHPDHLAEQAELWLAPLLAGKRRLDLSPQQWIEGALSLLDWDERQLLDRRAPRHFESPAGSTHAIDYSGDDAPSVEVRAQALFGLTRHPMIGDTPLLIKLTSPAGRPIQSTRDLPAFWSGSWHEVAKEMRGRYPKHAWPDDPASAPPTLRTKRASRS
ncbi:ATP-dependent helicase HrpB [Sphingomicrobium lutaoense]|uniref:RNA helicase n=1 Tax=Sphingomicrobium lutaoense TaxID=515949 RepID=A0A839YXI4_9SPHN|nr:ATP-dependent helicase HrpB [Sphingomicrobium lutaoense]MBB3763190.1 ATP-dependent helicase HrpB [Sphingomicrobium lutaoense]